MFNGLEGVIGTLGVFWVYSKGILGCSGSVQGVFPVMPGGVLGVFPGGSVDVPGMFWVCSGVFPGGSVGVLGVLWGVKLQNTSKYNQTNKKTSTKTSLNHIKMMTPRAHTL